MMSSQRYLRTLDNHVSDIDFAKGYQPEIVPAIITMACDTVDQMKMDLHDIGDLNNLIPPMASIFTNKPARLPVMIEAAHVEIERLLGADACKVYLPEAA